MELLRNDPELVLPCVTEYLPREVVWVAGRERDFFLPTISHLPLNTGKRKPSLSWRSATPRHFLTVLGAARAPGNHFLQFISSFSVHAPCKQEKLDTVASFFPVLRCKKMRRISWKECAILGECRRQKRWGLGFAFNFFQAGWFY